MEDCVSFTENKNGQYNWDYNTGVTEGIGTRSRISDPIKWCGEPSHACTKTMTVINGGLDQQLQGLAFLNWKFQENLRLLRSTPSAISLQSSTEQVWKPPWLSTQPLMFVNPYSSTPDQVSSSFLCPQASIPQQQSMTHFTSWPPTQFLPQSPPLPHYQAGFATPPIMASASSNHQDYEMGHLQHRRKAQDQFLAPTPQFPPFLQHQDGPQTSQRIMDQKLKQAQDPFTSPMGNVLSLDGPFLDPFPSPFRYIEPQSRFMKCDLGEPPPPSASPKSVSTSMHASASNPSEPPILTKPNKAVIPVQASKKNVTNRSFVSLVHSEVSNKISFSSSLTAKLRLSSKLSPPPLPPPTPVEDTGFRDDLRSETKPPEKETQKPQREFREERKIVVGNLPTWIKKPEFEEFFRQFGPIENVILLKGHHEVEKNAGFGFIIYATEKSAMKAVEFDGVEFHGRILTVKLDDGKRLKTKAEGRVRWVQEGEEYVKMSNKSTWHHERDRYRKSLQRILDTNGDNWQAVILAFEKINKPSRTEFGLMVNTLTKPFDPGIRIYSHIQDEGLSVCLSNLANIQGKEANWIGAQNRDDDLILPSIQLGDKLGFFGGG